MELEALQSRVSHGVGELRDRTADLLGADGGSVFRELSRLGRRVDEARNATERRIDASEAMLSERIDDLATAERRTSWPRRLFWMLLGCGVGMAAGFLSDPDRGRGRRSQMTDQLTARGREVTDQMRKKAKVVTDRTRGQVMERVKDARPETPTADQNLLEQRIKSEVFGHRDDTSEVVILVNAPGRVALRGTVPNSMSERELLSAVADVDGVVDVRSELEVRQG